MEIYKATKQLKQAVDAFDLEFAVLASVDGTVLDLVNSENKDDFISLYNSSFYDEGVIMGLYEHLQASILPQMVSQGNKFSYLGVISGEYVYGVFGKTNKTGREQYIFSKEIDSLITDSLQLE